MIYRAALMFMGLSGCDPASLEMVQSTYRILALNPICVAGCVASIAAADTDQAGAAVNTTTQTTNQGPI